MNFATEFIRIDLLKIKYESFIGQVHTYAYLFDGNAGNKAQSTFISGFCWRFSSVKWLSLWPGASDVSQMWILDNRQTSYLLSSSDIWILMLSSSTPCKSSSFLHCNSSLSTDFHFEVHYIFSEILRQK